MDLFSWTLRKQAAYKQATRVQTTLSLPANSNEEGSAMDSTGEDKSRPSKRDMEKNYSEGVGGKEDFHSREEYFHSTQPHELQQTGLNGDPSCRLKAQTRIEWVWGNEDKVPCPRGLLPLPADLNRGHHGWESVVLSTEPQQLLH